MSNYLYYDYPTSHVCNVKNNTIEYLNYPTIHSYLNHACLLNGSSLEGRKESYRYLMHSKKFTPIFISHTVIYFPTEPVKNNTCRWINYCQIQSITYEKKLCTIHFKDCTQLQCSHPNRIKNTINEIQIYLQFYMPSY